MAPEDQAPPPPDDDAEAADSRPFGMRAATFAHAAERLLDNGYAPLPIRPGTKVPVPNRWSTRVIDADQIEQWVRDHPRCGVGLRTGALVGFDLDLDDPDLAHDCAALVERRLGATLVRVGRWPRLLLLYRTAQPFAKLQGRGVEVLGLGQQFVAFGIHPDTGAPYGWPLGDTPLDTPLDALPLACEDACRSLVAEIGQLLPGPEARTRRRREAGGAHAGQGPTRDADGRVSDGRDGWLSIIAFHAVHDALDAGRPLDAAEIADVAWRRFAATTDLDRPKQDGSAPYSAEDAAAKVADKLRLLREGRLPPRAAEEVEAPDLPPALPVEQARVRLDEVLNEACVRVFAWHTDEAGGPAPQIGVKASVGLGKSSAARRHLIALRERLDSEGAPSRILILTPSLALADETAWAWRAAGQRTAVHRGYEARHPALRWPMCADPAAVRAAMDAGVDVQTTACIATSGARCARFDGCLKQANRLEVADADIVVAAYDALFTGFAIQPESIGLIVIDEGCWARSHEALDGLQVETFVHDLLSAQTRSRKPEAVGDVADLQALRGRAVAAFVANGAGPMARSRLMAAGLTAEDAVLAGRLEHRRIRDPGLWPGMPAEVRQDSLRQAAINARSRLYIAAWEAIGRLLSEGREVDGRLEITSWDAAAETGSIVLRRRKPIHPNLRGKPVLHLDATLRPELVRTVLPELEVTEIAADAPHMRLRLVTGPFGKGSLCDGPALAAAELTRRANRLAECVDYVRWHARRFTRTLVVSYKDIEPAFADIAGVETAHFNAIAGLDGYRRVDLLIVVGRPLPGSGDLGRMCAAVFGHVPKGGYRRERQGVHMRSGAPRGLRTTMHSDPIADMLRAAICDDELVQAIGRGRGVNRTATEALEVHVLANVALPLVHDRLSCWEIEAPDVVQRMLLAGMAVDSAEHAAMLHPQFFANAEAAKKQFQRAGFKGHSPIDISYREMSLKSAAYRRPGRGRSWQRACWIDGDATQAKAALERVLGALADWRPDPA